MKRTPKTTRKERQAAQGKGPGQAWFPSGRDFAYVSPTTKQLTDKPVPKSKTAPDCPQCGPGARFRTVNKAKRHYGCRRCGAVLAD